MQGNEITRAMGDTGSGVQCLKLVAFQFNVCRFCLSFVAIVSTAFALQLSAVL